MFSPKLNSYLLNSAAILVGLVVPSLIFGRALIAVFLGLGLILALIASNHKEIWADIRPYLSKGFIGLITLTILGTALNIPFSLRIDLSIEAWARSWLILGATYYLLFCLKNHISLILKTLSFSLFIILILGVNSVLHIPKLVSNGLLLALPVCFYQCYKERSLAWSIISGLSVLLYISCVLQISSKASLAGMIIIAFSCLVIFGVARLSLIKTSLIVAFCTFLLIGGLSIWLPDQLNASSTLNAQSAPLPIWLVDFHRQLIWLFSIDLIQQSPWIGSGLNAGNFHSMAQNSVVEHFGQVYANLPNISNAPIYPSHAHNWFLEILIDGGIIGAICLLSCVILLFFFSIKTYFQTHNAALLAFIGVNAGYWGTGLLNFSFWSVWWQAIYFMTSSLLLVQYLHEKQTNDT